MFINGQSVNDTTNLNQRQSQDEYTHTHKQSHIIICVFTHTRPEVFLGVKYVFFRGARQCMLKSQQQKQSLKYKTNTKTGENINNKTMHALTSDKADSPQVTSFIANRLVESVKRRPITRHVADHKRQPLAYVTSQQTHIKPDRQHSCVWFTTQPLGNTV